MPQVSISINGRSYPVACDEGEEDRIRDLARIIDSKVAGFARQVGQAGEARLLVLAALVITDELAEAHATLRRQSAASGNGVDTAALAQGLEELAKRIETIAVRLETPHIGS